uniref:Uncharacterized protein n=1 Tax=Rhipicephalus appendiculatus TaxID=34631 RepID=A0A131YBA1_RHIAP
MFSEGGVTGRPVHDVSLQYTPIGAGLCRSALEEEMPRTYRVASYYALYKNAALSTIQSTIQSTHSHISGDIARFFYFIFCWCCA